MTVSTTVVSTPHASRYLQQLAKHWAHKFPVQFTATEGSIMLPFGTCALKADEEWLDIRLTGEAGTDWDKFEQVVADHLKRFGHREELAFDWRRVS